MSIRALMSSSQPVEAGFSCPEHVLCVLGMHRSGTSCLTGSLQEAGLELGEHHTENPHNLKGNRENQGIVDINDAVLAANGGAWDVPPETVTWPDAQLQAARALLSRHADAPHFGFKDPRTLLTIGGWQALAPHMRFIGIFRHPAEVAQSLQNRSGMPLEQGLALWYQYNRRLLRQYRCKAFPLLCFDESEELFLGKLRGAMATVGLEPHGLQGDFYTRELKTARVDAELPLPWHIRRLYRKLLRLAE